jgi:hypothetical protein
VYQSRFGTPRVGGGVGVAGQGEALSDGLHALQFGLDRSVDQFLVSFPDQPVEILTVSLLAFLPAVGTGGDGLETGFSGFDKGHAVSVGGLEMKPLPFCPGGKGVGDGRECLIKGHGKEACHWSAGLFRIANRRAVNLGGLRRVFRASAEYF